MRACFKNESKFNCEKVLLLSHIASFQFQPSQHSDTLVQCWTAEHRSLGKRQAPLQCWDPDSGVSSFVPEGSNLSLGLRSSYNDAIQDLTGHREARGEVDSHRQTLLVLVLISSFAGWWHEGDSLCRLQTAATKL